MRRALFFLVILLILFGACSDLGPVRTEEEGLKFFVWMSEGKDRTSGVLRAQFAKFQAAGVDGVMYLCSPDRYPEVVEIADEFGLEIHAWLVIMNCRDKDIMENHKDWFTINGLGQSSRDYPPFVGYYSWLCPSNEEVQEYLVRRVSALADTAGLTSIHLDYIRYSDVILPSGLWSKYDLVMDREYPEFDFCYCDVCIRQFEAEAGYDPSKLEDPSLDAKWRQYRFDSITRVVNTLADVVHNRGKLLTAAVFPTPSIAKKMVRQEWVKWNLDAIYPMVYHSFYEEDVAWIGEAVDEGMTALGGKIPLVSGLYIPDLNPEELAEAVDYAFAAGASGICLFSSGAMSGAHWERLAGAVKKHKGLR